MTTTQRRLWTTAGWLLIASVVLTLAGAAFGPNSRILDKLQVADRTQAALRARRSLEGG